MEVHLGKWLLGTMGGVVSQAKAVYNNISQTIVNVVDYSQTGVRYAMRELLSLSASMVNFQAQAVGAEEEEVMGAVEEEERVATEHERAREEEARLSRVAKLVATRGRARGRRAKTRQFRLPPTEVQSRRAQAARIAKNSNMHSRGWS